MTTGPSFCRAATRPASPRTSVRATASCRQVTAGVGGGGAGQAGPHSVQSMRSVALWQDGNRGQSSCCSRVASAVTKEGPRLLLPPGESKPPGYVTQDGWAQNRKNALALLSSLPPSPTVLSPSATSPRRPFQSRRELETSHFPERS